MYGEYLKFKSTVHVLDPTYATLHKEAVKSIRKGEDTASAVQGARDAGIIFQTPASSSKDTLPKPAPKPKGRPKKWVAKTD